MQAYDLMMLIVLAMATIFGAIKGFAWQVASIASVIASYIVAYRFRFDVAEMIQAKPPWNQFLAMLILYVGTSFVIWVGFRLFSGMIDRVRLKEFDRHLGAAFGLTKGLIYCLLITMFAMSLLGPNQQAAICQSRSGFYIATALDRGVGVLPKEIHDVVAPYLTSLDDKLQAGQQVPSSEISGSPNWGQVGENFGPSGTQNDGRNSAQNAVQNLGQSIGQSFGQGLRDGIGQQLGNGVSGGLNNLPEMPSGFSDAFRNVLPGGQAGDLLPPAGQSPQNFPQQNFQFSPANLPPLGGAPAAQSPAYSGQANGFGGTSRPIDNSGNGSGYQQAQQPGGTVPRY